MVISDWSIRGYIENVRKEGSDTERIALENMLSNTSEAEINRELDKTYSSVRLQRFWYRGMEEQFVPKDNDCPINLTGKLGDASYSEEGALVYPKRLNDNYQAIVIIDLNKFSDEEITNEIEAFGCDPINRRHSQLRFNSGIPAGAYRVIRASELGYERGQRIESYKLTKPIGKAMLELITSK